MKHPVSDEQLEIRFQSGFDDIDDSFREPLVWETPPPPKGQIDLFDMQLN